VNHTSRGGSDADACGVQGFFTAEGGDAAAGNCQKCQNCQRLEIERQNQNRPRRRGDTEKNRRDRTWSESQNLL